MAKRSRIIGTHKISSYAHYVPPLTDDERNRQQAYHDLKYTARQLAASRTSVSALLRSATKAVAVMLAQA